LTGQRGEVAVCPSVPHTPQVGIFRIAIWEVSLEGLATFKKKRMFKFFLYKAYIIMPSFTSAFKD
jgi:hypothetical protein